MRVRLISYTHAIDTNSPSICEVLDIEQLMKLTAPVGLDVLRSDANPELAFK